MYPDQAGKIVGMLLENPWRELVGHLQSSDALEAIVNQAMQVLKHHGLEELQEVDL